MASKTQKKILVIEDEKDIIKLLTYNLEKEGYQVGVATDGEAGLQQFKKLKPDLVLLDLMLPKRDGTDVCQTIRKEFKTPIMMLTAKRGEIDRILGLELGADDYVTKPFSIREVMARIKGIFRRVDPMISQTSSFHVGALEIDFDRYEVKLNGTIVRLSSKEFEFLKNLIEAQGRVLTREKLLETIWGIDESLEIDTRTVDQHITRLRNKLGSESNRIITVKNVGYRFKPD